MISLRPLSSEDMETVRLWRIEIPETTRTPFLLTKEQQQDYYRTVICDRRSTTRYWGVWDGPAFVGMGGIENIEWENRRGEISVLINPERRGKGYGKQAVKMFLSQAFDNLGLLNVWGECYYCSPAVGFWEKLIEEIKREYSAYSTRHPAAKFFNGKLHDSLWFNFPAVRND